MTSKIKQGFTRTLRQQSRIGKVKRPFEREKKYLSLAEENIVCSNLFYSFSFGWPGHSIAKRNGKGECQRRRRQLENGTHIQLSGPGTQSLFAAAPGVNS